MLKEKVTKAFEDRYSQAPEMIVAAPGRVNLIGEHTDYNDGFVLPCAIDYETMVAIGQNERANIDAVACDFEGETDRFNPADPFAKQPVEWKNHVRGVAASLAERGVSLKGCNIAIAGNVPQGAGLSSSASLGVALTAAFAEMHQLDQLDKTDFALIAQHAENHYVGCACGIMDQLVSARATAGCAMLIDCRSLATKPISMLEGAAILVIHSGIERGLVDSAYNERRTQCEQAARHYGVDALRDLDVEQLKTRRAGLDELSYRRARHVVTENARTLAATDALIAGDMNGLSLLMAKSHASMRDDFEITLPSIDDLVALAADFLGNAGGVRMTGGGFGGCIVAILPEIQVEGLKERLVKNLPISEGNVAPIFHCNTADGVSIL